MKRSSSSPSAATATRLSNLNNARSKERKKKSELGIISAIKLSRAVGEPAPAPSTNATINKRINEQTNQ